MCSTDIFLGVLALLFPPLPVWVKRGICSADSLINILLCVLGFVPGLLHAWYIIAKYPEPPYDYDYQNLPQDPEHGDRIYVYVQRGRQQQHQQQGYQPQQGAKPQRQQQGGNMNYGTNGSNSGGGASAQSQPQPQEQGTTNAAGPSDGGAPPPSYAQVVAGDHKVQTHD